MESALQAALCTLAGLVVFILALRHWANVCFRERLYEYHGCRVPSPGKYEGRVFFCQDCPKIWIVDKIYWRWNLISEKEVLYYPMKKEELWTNE